MATIMTAHDRLDSKGFPYATLSMSDGSLRKDGTPILKEYGLGHWEMVDDLLSQPDGPEMIRLYIQDLRDRVAALSVKPENPTPIPPLKPVPVEAKPTVPTVETPKPTPVPATVQPPAPKATKPNRSKDYCPVTITRDGNLYGLRDGQVYQWHAPRNGTAPHWRKSPAGCKVRPAHFLTPSEAPTVQPKATIPTVKTPAPSADNAPKCVPLGTTVLRTIDVDGMRVTIYSKLPGEDYHRSTVLPVPAAKVA